MKQKIALLDIEILKPHEEINPTRLLEVKKQLLKDGYLKNPVVVDRKTKVVLDGHHRLAVFKELGYKKLPALLINYQSHQIKVFPRRASIKSLNLKQQVINRGLIGNLFLYKSTRHYIKDRIKNINFKLVADKIKK